MMNKSAKADGTWGSNIHKFSNRGLVLRSQITILEATQDKKAKQEAVQENSDLRRCRG
jgi:hypothetical protein